MLNWVVVRIGMFDESRNDVATFARCLVPTSRATTKSTLM